MNITRSDFSCRWIKRTACAAVLCGLVFFLEGQTYNKPVAGPAKVQAKTPSKVTGSKAGKHDAKVLYRFSEHLAEAQTEIYIPAKEESRPGKWDGNQFVMENLSAPFNIQKTVQPFNKELKQAITLKTIPEAVRILCFHNVPAGSKMVVYSGVPDSAATAEGQTATVYLTVWTGIHRQARFPITTGPGWNSIQLDLGVVSMLMKNIIVTFEITIDDRTNRPFAFDAEILD